MSKHFDREVCPVCNSEDYTIVDYGDDFDEVGGGQWWRCYCNKCGCAFDIERSYIISDISVSIVHNGN